MNILFVCTSNKDRSPALENHFRAILPKHQYRSAGINRYHTRRKNTRYLEKADIEWANFVVFAEPIHEKITVERFPNDIIHSTTLVLGDYSSEKIGEYVKEAEKLLFNFLDKNN
jgi:predicted protein tyrosine phosphatase